MPCKGIELPLNDQKLCVLSEKRSFLAKNNEFIAFFQFLEPRMDLMDALHLHPKYCHLHPVK